MERKFAHLISVLFHPLLMPTFAALLLFNIPSHFNLSLSVNYRYLVPVFVFTCTFVFPALVLFIYLKMGFIKSLEMKDRKERALPLITMAGIYYLTYFFLKQGPVPTLFNFFMIGATLLVLVSLLVNYFEKLSIHMVAMGGLFGTFAGLAIAFHYDLRLMLFLLALVAGFTGFARLKLKAHTEAQVYTGFGLGVLVMMGLFLFV
ncbi:MAG: hypothetical protein L3J66_13810 [Bacteroidales bacterium]|nr:hypothetical protein [Bacteroidales bacterium]